ncbi:MAG: ribose 5-phosphate isomerase B [Rhodospirillales bacterium]|nr:ribose 5-phosphate isomerase B [Rhodospirillales bacterium]
MVQPQSLVSTLAIGSDHGGLALKHVLFARLRDAGVTVHDFGTDNPASVDYPDFAHAVCRAVTGGSAERGILVCGTGIGMSIAANRHPGIRCVLAHDVTTARLGREHNDGNVLALGGRILGEELAWDIVATFLATRFDGGRHERRLAKLTPA